jgi:hypothetical protein
MNYNILCNPKFWSLIGIVSLGIGLLLTFLSLRSQSKAMSKSLEANELSKFGPVANTVERSQQEKLEKRYIKFYRWGIILSLFGLFCQAVGVLIS